ncbi:hypothetical protein JCM5350_007167 [Sporobolomyces pararoseus]
MPIPSLPLDIVIEIISHLEEEEEYLSQQIENGKTTSLVCRSWKPIGQALRWKAVQIISPQLPSLINHLSEHPHLSKLIKALVVEEPRSDTPIDYGAYPKDNDFLEMPNLLEDLTNLQMFAIKGQLGANLTSTVKVAAKLRNLKSLQLFVIGRLVWSNELALILETGFKNLISFTYRHIGLITSNFNRDGDEPPGPKFSPTRLDTGWTVERSEASQFANNFFSVLNLTSLRSVALWGLAACNTFLQWLAKCPNLNDLRLRLLPSENLQDFPSYLSVLTRFSSLKWLGVEIEKEHGLQLVESPVSLSDVLAGYPSSLVIFQLRQFVFTDYSIIPTRRCPPDHESEHKYIFTRKAPHEEEEGDPDEMVVWGEENEGKISWYRDAKDEREEEEPEAARERAGVDDDGAEDEKDDV